MWYNSIDEACRLCHQQRISIDHPESNTYRAVMSRRVLLCASDRYRLPRRRRTVNNRSTRCPGGCKAVSERPYELRLTIRRPVWEQVCQYLRTRKSHRAAGRIMPRKVPPPPLGSGPSATITSWPRHPRAAVPFLQLPVRKDENG